MRLPSRGVFVGLTRTCGRLWPIFVALSRSCDGLLVEKSGGGLGRCGSIRVRVIFFSTASRLRMMLGLLFVTCVGRTVFGFI